MKRYVLTILFAAAVWSAAAQQAESLSADVYRRRVLDYSVQIKQSGEQAEAVRQAMREAKASFLPTLDFGGTAQYRVTDYDMGLLGKMRPESYSLEADVRQVVYAGGGVKHGFQAAKLQHEIALKSEELTTANVVYSATLTYWSTSAKRSLYLLTSHYVKLIGDLTAVIEGRFEEGLISKTDLLQIQARLSEARIQNNEAYKSYQLGLQNLNIMMGEEPLMPVKPADPISRPDSIPGSILSLDEVLDRRGEFDIARMNVDYQIRQLKITRGKYMPQLVVGMKNGWGTQMLNLDGATLFNSYFYGQLNIPIFRGGGMYKGVASQRALVRSTELAVQQTRDQISQELYAAYTSLVESHKQIAIAEQACQISKQSLDLNTFSYNEGKLPIVDVLSAQVAWVQSNSALIQTWLQEKVAYADYNKAVGNLEY